MKKIPIEQTDEFNGIKICSSCHHITLRNIPECECGGQYLNISKKSVVNITMYGLRKLYNDLLTFHNNLSIFEYLELRKLFIDEITKYLNNFYEYRSISIDVKFTRPNRFISKLKWLFKPYIINTETYIHLDNDLIVIKSYLEDTTHSIKIIVKEEGSEAHCEFY